MPPEWIPEGDKGERYARMNLDRLYAENRCLPRNADGHIVSPYYLPVGSSYLSVWREWLKKTPKSEWPDWLRKDIERMRKRGTRSTLRSDASTPGSAAETA